MTLINSMTPVSSSLINERQCRAKSDPCVYYGDVVTDLGYAFDKMKHIRYIQVI